MNKTYSIFITLLCMAYILFSCNSKNQIITVKVVDFKTGLPLDSVFLDYYVSYIEQSRGSMNTVFIDYHVRTNDRGEYTFSIEPDESYDITHASKVGYKHNCCWGNVNPIQLVPLDCTLRLQVKNEFGLHDSLHVILFNGAFSHYKFSEGRLYPPKSLIVLPKGETYVQNVDLASDYFTYLYWDKAVLKKNTYSQFLKDSVYLNKGDTIDYIIKY